MQSLLVDDFVEEDVGETLGGPVVGRRTESVSGEAGVGEVSGRELTRV